MLAADLSYISYISYIYIIYIYHIYHIYHIYLSCCECVPVQIGTTVKGAVDNLDRILRILKSVRALCCPTKPCSCSHHPLEWQLLQHLSIAPHRPTGWVHSRSLPHPLRRRTFRHDDAVRSAPVCNKESLSCPARCPAPHEVRRIDSGRPLFVSAVDWAPEVSFKKPIDSIAVSGVRTVPSLKHRFPAADRPRPHVRPQDARLPDAVR